MLRGGRLRRAADKTRLWRIGLAAAAAALAVLAVALASAGRPTAAQEPAAQGERPAETAWSTTDEDGTVRLNVHFFWAIGCPYCEREEAYLETLKTKYAWLNVIDYEVTEHRENVRLVRRMAKAAGGSTSLVPTTFICNQMTVGFISPDTTGEVLERQMLDCYNRILGKGREAAVTDVAEDDASLADVAPIELPIIGRFDPGSASLPLLTVAIATVDAFNPCGLFVLLMLMSMMIRARSRTHMVVIGAAFTVTWATMYLLLMTAWLSLFEYVGDITLITTAAGAVALGMAAINFKDYLGVRRGPSLSISEKKKAGLLARMGQLTRRASRWTAADAGAGGRGGAPSLVREYLPMASGAVLLTLSAGGYALLCTTGFAMTYARVLTLHDLPTLSYLLYLWFYVSIYMVPMTLIVIAFTVTLGSRKLQDSEGRALKLLAAIMLASLGAILIASPDLLKNPLIVVVIMMAAFVVTAIVMSAENMMRPRPKRGRAAKRAADAA
jgi:glutaredoxin